MDLFVAVNQPAFTVDLSSSSHSSHSSHSSRGGDDRKQEHQPTKGKAKSSSSNEKSSSKKDSRSSSSSASASRHARPSGPVNTLPAKQQGGDVSSSSSSSSDASDAKKDNSIINSSKDCQGPFPGYPYCQDKVNELRGNWMINAEQEAYYRSKGVDGTQCSFLTYLNLNGFYCEFSDLRCCGSAAGLEGPDLYFLFCFSLRQVLRPPIQARRRFAVSISVVGWFSNRGSYPHFSSSSLRRTGWWISGLSASTSERRSARDSWRSIGTRG